MRTTYMCDMILPPISVAVARLWNSKDSSRKHPKTL